MFRNLDRSIRNLLEGVVRVVYFMRGSVQYDDIMFRTPFERQIMEEFIEKRLEAEGKKHFPMY